MARNQPSDLLYLFDRPSEPTFFPKEDGAAFDVPSSYLTERFQADASLQSDVLNRFGAEGSGKKIPVKQITPPDLSSLLQLKERDNFSVFFPYHRRLAAQLIEIFMGMPTLDDFVAASVYCSDRLNPYLFIYALSVAILHRPDTKKLSIPSLCEVFPGKFIDRQVFSRARFETNVIPTEQRAPIEIPLDYTATDLDTEHRVAYFREDIGLNLHHWHWHLVYPFLGPRNIVAKDRRGELFFYHHQQIIARYNFERLSNRLGLTKRLTEWHEPIEEGYFPKLDTLVSSRNYPPRFANVKLQDINRPLEQMTFDIADLERWRDRIYAAIHSGIVIDNEGKEVQLTENGGIDILGDMIEASILSVNRNLYGDLHNFGHVVLGLCHDPDHRNLEFFGTVADPATSMRDPVFYRWHAFIDDIFQEHKSTLSNYTVQQLDYPGVKVTGVEVQTEGRGKNQFDTFWQKNDVNLSRGLDFQPRGEVFARITHLQHTPFTYKISADNTTKSNKMGTVRIFMSPKFDDRGTPLLFRDQKRLFVELDKFFVNLKPGKNNITRKSTQSSVTIPFERTFRNVDINRPAEGTTEADRFNFCGCGWPQHLLIAKGNGEGFACDLFVMISNFDGDKVQTTNNPGECSDAASYCGIRDSLYPDKRPMGFPFDRRAREGVDYLPQFLTPNMRTVDVSIKFRNVTVEPPQQGQQSGGNRNQPRRN